MSGPFSQSVLVEVRRITPRLSITSVTAGTRLHETASIEEGKARGDFSKSRYSPQNVLGWRGPSGRYVAACSHCDRLSRSSCRCQTGSSAAFPAVGPDGESVDTPVCAGGDAEGLLLSLDEQPGRTSVTIENVGDETVPVNPGRWTVFRKTDAEQHTGVQTWRVAANAPAGTHNLTVEELAHGEIKTWNLTYDPNVPDAQIQCDRTIDKPGQYAFSLAVNNRTYTGSFQLEA